MELVDFLRETQAEVQAEIRERLGTSSEAYPYPELVFAEIVIQHMSEVGMTFEPQPCHYSSRSPGGNLRISGYAVSDETDQLDLFVSLYQGCQEVTPVPDSETRSAVEQCLQFLSKAAAGTLAATLDPSSEAHALAATIQAAYANLDQIRIYVLTDRQAKAKNFKDRDIRGKTVKLEVMDIERLHRHCSEGKPRDELVVDFEEVAGGALPCVYLPGQETEYSCALVAIPAEALRFMYEKFGARLLESNVRSFLSATTKVNKGIRETLRDQPERFLAYNNGIVIVADEAHLGRTADGGPGVRWLKGMQVVNGGQTTASIYFAKKKSPDIDLRKVRVPAKIVILTTTGVAAEEALISEISKYANSQTAVKQSDLSANKPFHVEMEKLSLATYCPDGVGRWFYERAAGSYNTLLAREGNTPASLRRLRQVVMPPSRKITKTDMARYLNAWDGKPEVVSLGSQKNFVCFMDGLKGADGESPAPLPDVHAYKDMIAKTILFKKAQAMVRPMFPAFQANVVAYLVSVAVDRLGPAIDLSKIWARQALPESLLQQLRIWAVEVHEALHRTAEGRMVSEWAKKPECWEGIRRITYSAPLPALQRT
jgi:hypothetical protein